MFLVKCGEGILIIFSLSVSSLYLMSLLFSLSFIIEEGRKGEREDGRERGKKGGREGEREVGRGGGREEEKEEGMVNLCSLKFGRLKAVEGGKRQRINVGTFDKTDSCFSYVNGGDVLKMPSELKHFLWFEQGVRISVGVKQ